jgi:hopanoid C-3 methylase
MPMTRKPVRVTLVEVPAVEIEMDGESVLDEFTLNHPKYPQLLLASNLRRAADFALEVDVVDLKGGSDPTTVTYGQIDYCGRRLDLRRVGVPFERVAERLFSSDIVGISANFTLERSMVVQTIEYLKARIRPPLIVVGGHDATADPMYYLQRGADLCVLGEGETAILEIVRAVANGETPMIKGTASLEDGALRRDARRPVHRYEDIVFPDLDLLTQTSFDQSPDGPIPEGVSPRITSLETSRGCPEACSFCDVSFIVGRFRPVPFDMLVQRVRTFKAAGIRTIQVIDDNLLYRTLPAYEGERGRQTVLDLFHLLYDEGFAWEFFNGFQLGLFERDGAIDLELIDALYRNGHEGGHFVGCFRSYVPIDKVTAEEMSLLKKLKPLRIAQAVVGAIAECGVPALALGFVIGSIRDTPRSLEETAIRAEEFSSIVTRSSGSRTAPVVLPLCSVPLPGTPDFRYFHDNILFPADQYPELYNVFMSVLRNNHFTPLDLTLERRHMRDRLNGAGEPTAEAALPQRQ